MRQWCKTWRRGSKGKEVGGFLSQEEWHWLGYIYIYIYRKFQLVSFSCDSKPYNFLAQICLNVFLHIKGMKIIAFSYMLVPLFFQRLKFPFGSLCLEFFQEKLMLFFLVPLVCQSHFVISTAVKFFNLYILWVGSTYKLGFGESSLC